MDPQRSVFRGKIRKRIIYPQSRSERHGYVLYVNDEKYIPLEVQGRDPFQQEAFRPFDGHVVVVEGHNAGDAIVASKVFAEDEKDLFWQLDFKRGRICNYCKSPISDDIVGFCPVCGARLTD